MASSEAEKYSYAFRDVFKQELGSRERYIASEAFDACRASMEKEMRERVEAAEELTDRWWLEQIEWWANMVCRHDPACSCQYCQKLRYARAHISKGALELHDAEKDKLIERLTSLLNTPEIEDFDKAVPLEAAHQVQRWSTEHDAGKNPEDWFWLVGYLAGKALSSFKGGNFDKAKHHCISTAAALRNWHAHIRSGHSEMRPGIDARRSADTRVGEQ